MGDFSTWITLLLSHAVWIDAEYALTLCSWNKQDSLWNDDSMCYIINSAIHQITAVQVSHVKYANTSS